MPTAASYSMRKLLLIIGLVEEQNQGLDSPSYPPCWCRSKCINGTKTDKHQLTPQTGFAVPHFHGSFDDTSSGPRRRSTQHALLRRRRQRQSTAPRVLSLPSQAAFVSTEVTASETRVAPTNDGRGPVVNVLRTTTKPHTLLHWTCAQRSSVRFGEFRVDCCGSSISPRSHQILMMSIFQSTGPRSIGGWKLQVRFGLSLVVTFFPRRHIPHRSPRSSIFEAGENHGFCLHSFR